MDQIVYRNARPDDREEVVAFTANTWEHGDYISFVFDKWLADRHGRFLIIEDQATGKIVGIDKLTMLSLHEAWFEGLRIREEYRGRGLATNVQRYMIGEARRLGANTVRFITRVGNTPIHLAAYRDGFAQVAMVRGFRWNASKDEPIGGHAYELRRATSNEAPLLYEGWRRSSAYRTAGMINISWNLRSTSKEEWQVAAQAGDLLLPSSQQPTNDYLPVPCVLLRAGGEKAVNAWTVSAVSASTAEWEPLLGGLLAAARAEGIAEIEGLLSDEHALYTAIQAAGITPSTDDFCHCVFELDLTL